MPNFGKMTLSELVRPEGYDCACGRHHVYELKYLNIGRGIVGETLPYKMESIEKVRMCSPNDLYFASRIVGGVNLVTLDDSYYTVTRTQLELLRREAEKGMPIVLCMHGPLHTQSLYDEMMDGGRGGSAWLVGTPDELRRGYRPAHCFALQQPDETTFEFIEYVKREPAIRVLLTGHLHRFRVDELAPGKPQILTGLSCRGEAVELTLQ